MKENKIVSGSIEITVRQMGITVEDLRTGKRVRVSEAECSQITGRGRHSLRRDRWLGQGIPYLRDECRRVWYSSEDVLDYLSKATKHKSVSEYDTSRQVKGLEAAREAKNRRSAK